MKNATITDVARLAGVSTATVSRVINGNEKVDAAMAEKVNNAISQLHYTPNFSARSMRRGHNDVISIILPTVNFSDILRGATDEAFALGLKLNLYATHGDPQREKECLRSALSSGSDGIVYCPVSAVGLSYLHSNNQSHIPVVITARRNVLPGVPHIYMDQVGACYQATKYLLQLRHRRIALLTGFWDDRPHSITDFLRMKDAPEAGLYPAVDRLMGYEAALKEYGIKLDPALIYLTGFEYDDGYRCCNEALASLCQFDALICPTDRVAAGALQALQEQNVHVPSQVSIIGYDDGIFAQATRPTLTATHQTSYRIGQSAVRSVFTIWQGQSVETIVYEPKLIVRNSTAAKELSQERTAIDRKSIR